MELWQTLWRLASDRLACCWVSRVHLVLVERIPHTEKSSFVKRYRIRLPGTIPGRKRSAPVCSWSCENKWPSPDSLFAYQVEQETLGKKKFGVWRALVSGRETLSPSNLSSCVLGQLPLRLPEWPFHDPNQTMLFPPSKKNFTFSFATSGAFDFLVTAFRYLLCWACRILGGLQEVYETGPRGIRSGVGVVAVAVWISVLPLGHHLWFLSYLPILGSRSLCGWVLCLTLRFPRSQLSTLPLVSGEKDLWQESFSKLTAPARPAVTHCC